MSDILSIIVVISLIYAALVSVSFGSLSKPMRPNGKFLQWLLDFMPVCIQPSLCTTEYSAHVKMLDVGTGLNAL